MKDNWKDIIFDAIDNVGGIVDVDVVKWLEINYKLPVLKEKILFDINSNEQYSLKDLNIKKDHKFVFNNELNKDDLIFKDETLYDILTRDELSTLVKLNIINLTNVDVKINISNYMNKLYKKSWDKKLQFINYIYQISNFKLKILKRVEKMTLLDEVVNNVYLEILYLLKDIGVEYKYIYVSYDEDEPFCAFYEEDKAKLDCEEAGTYMKKIKLY